MQAVALSTLVGSFMSAGNAAAATELGQIAAGDNRIGAIALLFAPAIGWVRVFRRMHVWFSICTSLRLALVGTGSPCRANGSLGLTTLPVDAQVLFNIGGPALNQLNDTAQKNKLAKRSVAAGLGLTAASLLAAQSADAAEIAQVMLHHCSLCSDSLAVLQD